MADHLRPLDSREEKLDELLDNYVEAYSTMFSGMTKSSGDGGGWSMPAMWNDSYRELERTLKRLRGLVRAEGSVSPGLVKGYCNLYAWYFLTPWVRVPVQRKNKKGKWYVVPKEFTIEPRRIGSPTAVLVGLAWISQEFVGEIYLPDALKSEYRRPQRKDKV